MATSPAGGSPRLRASERVPSTPSPRPPPTASAVQPCPLLELSAELRNNIWELAYTFRVKSRSETDLLEEPYPTPALLLTCHQIKSEATGFFEPSQHRYWKFIDFAHVSSRDYDQEKCENITAQLLRLDNSYVRRMESIYLELNRFEHRVQCNSIPGTNHTAWEICIWSMDHNENVSAIYAVGCDHADIPWRHSSHYRDEATAEDVLTMPQVMDSPPLAPREKVAQAWGAMDKSRSPFNVHTSCARLTFAAVKCAPFMYEGMRMKWAHDEDNRGLSPPLKLAHWTEEELAANATD